MSETTGPLGERAPDQNTRAAMQAIGASVDEQIPQNYGFVVLVFATEGTKGCRLNYVSNCKREEAVEVIKEWLEKVINHPNQHIP